MSLTHNEKCPAGEAGHGFKAYAGAIKRCKNSKAPSKTVAAGLKSPRAALDGEV